jgi:pimeloyl-ACP methyl ester carboxylesterase
MYHDEGSGPVLLCIHGFPTASWDWVQMWPQLTKNFRVIAPDMLGFGFSDKPRNYEYSLFDQTTLHEVLLGHLGISEIHIWPTIMAILLFRKCWRVN